MEVREARSADIPEILELQHACYPLLSKIALWRDAHLASHQERFPQGQFVAVIDDRIVGHSASLVAASRQALRAHSFREITGAGTFDTHRPDGDTLYGAEIMVHPDFRRRGIATRFYAKRFELVRRLGLRYFVAGGRMPGFEEHKSRLTPKQYVDEVVAGRILDRVLSAQLKAGLRVKAVMKDYLADPRSGNFATLLVWENPGVAGRAVRAKAR